MLNLRVVELDIPKITEEQWGDLLTARAAFIAEYRPEEPVPSNKDQRQFLSQIPELRDHVIFWLLYDDDNKCVGFCSMHHPKPDNPDYEANKDSIYVEPVVLAPYRRLGIGTQLLPLIIEYAQKVGASWLQWDTKFESGFRFSEKIGAIEAGRQRTNRLSIDQVNWDQMQEWVTEGELRNPATELLRIDLLASPSLLEPICDLITEINRNQPRDDLEGMSYTITPEEFVKQAKRLEESKTERVIFATREPNNTLSGVTDMFYSEANPTHVYISLTGVRREFQNHGLGKWLKAAMLLDMHERHPEVTFVDTNNFNNNSPMLSINARVGFKLFEQYVFYKMRVEDLAAKVSSRSSDPMDNA